jgi:hypothetical protein
MAGYIGSKQGVTQVDGYNRSEADAEFVNDPNDVITVSGSNVGIGASSPVGNVNPAARVLQISGDNTNTPEVKAGGSNAEISISGGAAASYLWSKGAYPLVIATNATERMRIDSSGSVLVNTTSTSGGHQFGVFADSKTPMYLNRGTTTGGILSFYYAGSFSGSISVASGSTAYNTSSDYRLKENIVPLENALDRINKIPVRRFNFIEDPDRTLDGFLAHEVQEIVPEAVHGEKDAVDADGNPEYQGIDQSKLVPLLTAALQEALQKIDALEARVATLEGGAA